MILSQTIGCHTGQSKVIQLYGIVVVEHLYQFLSIIFKERKVGKPEYVIHNNNQSKSEVQNIKCLILMVGLEYVCPRR